jgi:hypothetical protein
VWIACLHANVLFFSGWHRNCLTYLYHLGVALQLPQGALPLSGSQPTTSMSIRLAPYATKQLKLCFYFPEAGVFKNAPVSVTKRGRWEHNRKSLALCWHQFVAARTQV